MSIEKGLLSEQDFNFGVGTFERKGRTGFPITVNQVSDLIAGTTGPIIDARRFTLFTDAVSAAVGKTLLIAGAVSLPAGVIIIPATVSVLPLQSGVINKGSATSLTINGPVVGNPMHQWMSGFAVGDVTFGVGSIFTLNPKWLGAIGNGVTGSESVNVTALQTAFNAYSAVDITDHYVVNNFMTLNSGQRINGLKKGKITTSLNGYIFKIVLKNDIKVKGLEFIGQQSPVANWAILIDDSDFINVKDNKATEIGLVIGPDGVYGSITDNNLSSYIQIIQNTCVITDASAGDFCPIFLRWVKLFCIAGNILNVTKSGIEVYGGNCNPSNEGIYGNTRKCRDGSIAGNIMSCGKSGINIAQAENISVSGNTVTGAGDNDLWVAASKNIVCSGNTTKHSGSSGIGLWGYQENIKFIGNTFSFNNSEVIAIQVYTDDHGGVYTNNIGPFEFIGNTFSTEGAYAVGASIYGFGICVFRNNIFKDVVLSGYGPFGHLTVENNEFYYKYGTADTYVNRWGSLDVFTNLTSPTLKIKGNKYVDCGSVGKDMICITSFETAGKLYIEDNEVTSLTNRNIFIVKGNTNGMSTVIKGNKLAGNIVVNPSNVTNYSLFWKNNENLTGDDYYGSLAGLNADDYFSVGSIIMDSTPTTLNPPGWVCVTAGTGTTAVWKAMANLA